MSERAARYRTGIYALIIAVAMGAWLPYVIPLVGGWLDTRHTRTTVAILYTTDTRGLLESCG